MKLYTYCQNNPVRYVEPSGHKSKCKLVQKITKQLPSVKNLENYLDTLTSKQKQAIFDKIGAAGGDADALKKIVDQIKKSGNSSTQMGYNPSTNKYPPRTPYAQSDSQMNPCDICKTFKYEYMKHANKGKKGGK